MICNCISSKLLMLISVFCLPFETADWKYRHAGLMAISACGEGCHKQMEQMLNNIVEAILPYLQDAVSYYSNYNSGDIVCTNSNHSMNFSCICGIKGKLLTPRLCIGEREATANCGILYSWSSLALQFETAFGIKSHLHLDTSSLQDT